MHQIAQTGKTTLEGKTFELELEKHHMNRSNEKCEKDCPKGWQMPTYQLLLSLRNNPQTRDQFNLLNTWEYVQNPDDVSREKGYTAWFIANSVGADLVCGGYPAFHDHDLGVRYMREISDKLPQ